MAGLISFAAPGLGQLYNGELKKAVVVFLCLWALLIVFLLGPVCRTSSGLVLGLAVIIAASIAVLAEAAVRAHRLRSFVLKLCSKWYICLAVICLANLVIFPLEGWGFKAAWFPFEATWLPFKAYRIPAASMAPTLVPGDCIIVELGSYRKGELRRGDIIVFPYPKDPTKDFVKRVIALGGQVVEIRDKKLLIDGKPVQEPYAVFRSSKVIPGDILPRDNMAPRKIPEGTVFVMGDNRDESHDSRFWGVVRIKQIRGKALYIYWSKDWSRIGKSIASGP